MEQSCKRLAVVFPGMGYTAERNLLKYTKLKASQNGYDVLDVTFSDLPKNVKGDKQKMHEAFEIAFAQADKRLSDIDFSVYEEVLFISKSLGTVVAAVYDSKYNVGARHIYMTPVNETFKHVRPNSGIMFHGLADPWCDNDTCEQECVKRGIELYTYEGANHSIECLDFDKDMECLRDVVGRSEAFIRGNN